MRSLLLSLILTCSFLANSKAQESRPFAQMPAAIQELPPEVRAPEPAELAQMEHLDTQVGQAVAQGQFVNALTAANDFVALAEATWGTNHPMTGIALSTRAFARAEAGLIDEAAADLLRYVHLHETALGPDHPLSFDARHFRANGLAIAGRADLALDAAARNAARARELGDDMAYYEFEAYMLQADLYRALADPMEEIASLRRALELVSRINGEFDVGALRLLSRIGRTLHANGESELAEQVLRDGLARYEAVYGDRHVQTAGAMHDLGLTLSESGQHDEAVALLDAASEIRRTTLGPMDQLTVASLSALSDALLRTDAAEEGERIAEYIYEISQDVFGTGTELALSYMRKFATALRQRGKDRRAVEVNRELLALIERSLGPEHPMVSIQRYDLADLYYYTGQITEARTIHQDIFEERMSRHGLAHNNTLLSLWSLATLDLQTGSPAAALDAYRRIEQNFDVILDSRGANLQYLRAEMAQAHQLLGQIELAVEILEDVIEATEELFGPENADVLTAKSHYAAALEDLGEYDRADAVRRQVLVARTRLLGPAHRSTIASLSSIAETLTAQDRGREAVPLLTDAIERAIPHLGEDHADISALRQLLGEAHYNSGQYHTALQHFTSAAQTRTRLFGSTSQKTLHSKRGLADALAALGRPDEAEAVLRQVIAATAEHNEQDKYFALDTELDLVSSLLDQNRADIALPIIERLAQRLDVQFGISDPATLFAQKQLAYTYLALERPGDALAPARRLVAEEMEQLVDSQGMFRSEVGQQEEFAAEAGALFALAAYLAGQADPASAPRLRAEAFEAVQAASQSGAAAATARAAARIAAADTGLATLVEDWERASAAREFVDETFVSLGGSVDAVKELSVLDAYRVDLDARLTTLTSRLREEFPAFFSMARPTPISIAELRGLDGAEPLLKDDEVLILLTPAWKQTRGLIWAISRDRAAWARLPLTAEELTVEIRALHAALDGGGKTRGGFVLDAQADLAGGFDRRRAYELYSSLFSNPEIAATIVGRKSWILVPQSNFLSLPFNALVTSAPDGSDSDPQALRETGWLGIERGLTVTPMVSLLRARRNPASVPTLATRGFFGIGDPDFQGVAENGEEIQIAEARRYFVGRSADADAVSSLARLPGTRAEVLAMAETFQTDASSYLLGADANESRIAELSDQGELARAGVVLFATHGLVAGSFDGVAEPALALTPPPHGPLKIANTDTTGPNAELRDFRIDDGLLTASEAARLKLRADWVILSACDTAAGAEPDAAGLTGLAQSFFYAGANALLVSHWKVRDDVAVRLTTDAVSRTLADPTLGKSEAIRAAMYAILSDSSADASGYALSHPAAWAPFQVISATAD